MSAGLQWGRSGRFDSWPDQHSRSINNRGEGDPFVITSANGETLKKQHTTIAKNKTAKTKNKLREGSRVGEEEKEREKKKEREIESIYNLGQNCRRQYRFSQR